MITFFFRVPISLQIIFVQDLLDLVSNGLNLINFESHISIEDLSQLSDEQIFAIAFFHRWTLTAIINYTISKKSNFALASIQYVYINVLEYYLFYKI